MIFQATCNIHTDRSVWNVSADLNTHGSLLEWKQTMRAMNTLMTMKSSGPLMLLITLAGK